MAGREPFDFAQGRFRPGPPAEIPTLSEAKFPLAVDASRLSCYIQKVVRVQFGLLVAAEFHP
jgi:hypothetical protein